MTTPPRRPSAASRATRRSRRPAQRSGSFLERNRSRLLWAVGGLAFLVIAGLAFAGFTRPTYACSSMWEPTPGPTLVAPTPAPVPSGATPGPTVTPRPPGIVQPDMGHVHENNIGATVEYAFCPPASGRHYPAPGGPIRGGFYGLGDQAPPPGWIHNLEHGALVLLYSCRAPEGQTAHACTDAGQDELRAMLATWPNSPICGLQPGQLTPVIARFDDMLWPYAALVWDVVLPMQNLDDATKATMFEFYAGQGEQFNPEQQCARPTPTPGPATPTPAASGSPAPSGSPGASPAASPAASTAPSPS